MYGLVRYFGGSGLLAVLIFGITLANVPRTPHMARQGARLLAFHAELSSAGRRRTKQQRTAAVSMKTRRGHE